jgi:hypothetical protein
MQAKDDAIPNPLVKPDFKTLAQETSPCLSIFVSSAVAPDQRGNSLRASLKTAEERFQEMHPSKSEHDEFFRPVRELLAAQTAPKDGTHSVAIFRSVDGLWHFTLPYEVSDAAILGNYFVVLPLVKTFCDEHEFYLLGLSQKHSRLLHCTLTSAEEISLPSTIPTNLFDYNQQDQPDHRLENRSNAGQVGKSKHPGQIISFGTGSDNDQKDHYLRNFFNAMDRELQSFLRERSLPLMLAGVDYELALYQSVSEYKPLIPGGVQGSPDGITGTELHARAVELFKSYNATRADHALGQYEKGDADRIPRSLDEIVPAAFDGRVLHLFVAEGFQETGAFNEQTRQLTRQANGDDLVNVAVLQTLAHAGDVYILPAEKVPGKSQVAALLRY